MHHVILLEIHEETLLWFVCLAENLVKTGSCVEFRNICLDNVTVSAASYINKHLKNIKKLKKSERVKLVNTKRTLSLVLRTLTGKKLFSFLFHES